MKKAHLVEFLIKTRIIANNDATPEQIQELALAQVRKYTFENDSYPYLENIVDIKEDSEVPYDSKLESL